jgi:sigma-B regulation protein RsbU (phosphoserine phosphatase)
MVKKASSGTSSGTATARRRDYIEALRESAARLASAAPKEWLGLVPELWVARFGAQRAELWLLDEKTSNAYLAHSAGHSTNGASHFAQAPARKTASGGQPQENAKLAALGAAASKFSSSSKLTNVTFIPLAANGRQLGAAACYTTGEADGDALRWWKVYADIASVVIHDSVAATRSQHTVTQLSLLFEATRLLNSTLDLAELLELILKIARDEVKADRGTVFMVDRKEKELWSIVASGLEHQEIRVPFGVGVAGRVAETGEVINVDDAYKLEFFERGFDQKFNYHTRSLLCLPIRHRSGEIVGVIELLNRAGGKQFTADDVDFLEKLSAHIAMALENARMHREIVEKQRMERDLALARSIQRGLLPEAPPVIPGFDIAVLNKMCYEVGGDYYDFLNLGPQTLLLVIADVEGKGVSSALVMSNLQATLRALVMHLHSLEVLALSLNDMFCQEARKQKFLSIFMGLVDTRGNKLHYINGGHVPPVLINAETGSYKLLDKGGMVVGMFADAVYSRGSEKLNKGDILVCCTDGILEADNRADEEYGTERLAACVALHRNKPAQGIVESVLEEVTQFSIGGQNIDDKVLMVMKVTSEGSGRGPVFRP